MSDDVGVAPGWRIRITILWAVVALTAIGGVALLYEYGNRIVAGFTGLAAWVGLGALDAQRRQEATDAQRRQEATDAQRRQEIPGER